VTRILRALAPLATLVLLGAGPAWAQGPGAPHTQVVSANPFGIMLEFFNAEYEHAAGESFTVGVGGSTFSHDNDTYLNADLFWRFYPDKEPKAFQGWSFGLKAGVTHIDAKTYAGAGFDVDRSWLLGKNENFYVGVGFGLKRLMGHGDELKIIPTIRLVNIGYAF
jgi:hypothetical protein